jgi:pimeloyl-ACP methyl ester carboxylesterase
MDDWAPVVALLSDRFRVTLVDRPGYGKSGPPVEPVNLARSRSLVHELIASLAVRLAPDGILRRQIESALGPDINAVDQDFFSLRIREWRRTAVLLTLAREEVRLDRDLKRSSANYSRIDAPLVIIQGEHDVYVTGAEARRLGQVVRNSRLYLSDSSGHYLQFGRPELIVAAIHEVATISPDDA